MRVKGRRSNSSSWQTLLALAFIGGLVAAALMHWLPWWLFCLMVLLNLAVLYALIFAQNHFSALT